MDFKTFCYEHAGDTFIMKWADGTIKFGKMGPRFYYTGPRKHEGARPIRFTLVTRKFVDVESLKNLKHLLHPYLGEKIRIRCL